MGYVVMKRRGDHVALVSLREFATREEALLDLSNMLADPSVWDDAASYVVDRPRFRQSGTLAADLARDG